MANQITKGANDVCTLRRTHTCFPNARTAFKAWMYALGISSLDTVLLPAYVGTSPKEGSGVFDPIVEIGARFQFYRMTTDLRIDIEDYRRVLANARPRLVVLIHYFGYPDPQYLDAVQTAHEQNVLVLEDEAHALYSDWIGGICGRVGDATIFSLHKMLPFPSGGLLSLNNQSSTSLFEKLQQSPFKCDLSYSPLDYDLFAIADARRRNALALLELIQPLRGKIDPLHTSLPIGVVPQTWPVIVTGRSRDELYFELNKRGFGVVSLYHTLIDEIRPEQYPDAHWLSRRILNLPVHQDIPTGALEAMVEELAQLV
ncbi:MAG: DegT/DnrJ/EryC1/StrS family aminotransferase [Chloroflexi bacterium]|nr:DegT/DnrJ/EryC1/StrS family aminotransferase [Chloroflexota bacterium]